MFNNLTLSKLYKASEELSNQLYNLTISSNAKGDNFYNGLHNTKMSGKGEQFLQFKEFRQGDDTKNIDWRKLQRQSDSSLFWRQKLRQKQ